MGRIQSSPGLRAACGPLTGQAWPKLSFVIEANGLSCPFELRSDHGAYEAKKHLSDPSFHPYKDNKSVSSSYGSKALVPMLRGTHFSATGTSGCPGQIQISASI